MSLNPIDRFSALRGPLGARGPQPAPRPEERAPAARDGAPAGPDEIEISSEAQGQLQVHEMVQAVRAAAGAVPDVRPERVEQARQRIQEGYYERADVRGSVVEALLRAFRPESN